MKQNKRELTKLSLKMKVKVFNPNGVVGMNSDFVYSFTCHFSKDKETYGNGWYCGIYPDDKQYSEKIIDLRYTEWNITDIERAKEFLSFWSNYYWSGENGAYKVKEIYFN